MNQIIEQEAFKNIITKGDRITTIAMVAYFTFGILISFYYNTFIFAFATGGLLIAGYFILKALLPHHSLYRYYSSAAYAVFMAQFIYQMHGMFEMHFFAFIGAILLICYQDWKLQIPNILVIVVHHALFAWLQYSGMKEIYFTQMDYMDLQTFIMHAALAAVIVGLCGYWAYNASQLTINDFVNLQNLKVEIANIEKNIVFAEKIKNGDFTSNIDLDKTTTTQDRLGAALLEMRDSLFTANIRENDEKYINIGVANINDILRRNMNSIDTMCTELVSEMTKYLDANQAGVYLVEHQYADSYLELKSHYAYNRKKYVNKRIEFGEGLVGQVYLEKEYVIITDLPDKYMTVTSGLGEATPSCLVLMPIKSNEVVVGIIEIASFKVMTTAQITYLNKSCEAIGTSISSAQLAQKTKQLLEEAQQQSEELKSQEEEMRQNLEELQATQEESMRSSQLYNQKLNAITNGDLPLFEFNMQGNIIKCNQALQKFSGYDSYEIEGNNYAMFGSNGSDSSVASLAADAKSGTGFLETKNGERKEIKYSYATIKNANAQIESIIKFIIPINNL